jgi:hypothetical protein
MSDGEKTDPPRPPLQDYLQSALVGDASKALGVYFRRVIHGMSDDVTGMLEDEGSPSTETSAQMAKLTSEMIKFFGQRVEDILQNYSSRAAKSPDDHDPAAPPGGSAPGS